MSHEVLDLLHFYRSTVGQVAFRAILSYLEKLWEVPPKCLTGIGYTDPFLDYYHTQDTKCLALSPGFTGLYARSGIENYPTALIQETNLPLKKNSVKNILCIHIIEYTAHPEVFLNQVFECLEPEGEVIFIVANRHGSWARNDNTPFGSGRPYSRKQLNHLIREAGFIVNDYHPALFIQPNTSFTASYYSKSIETIGRFFLPRYSGLHIVRAIKRIYVPPMKKSTAEFLDLFPEIPPLLPKGEPIREGFKPYSSSKGLRSIIQCHPRPS